MLRRFEKLFDVGRRRRRRRKGEKEREGVAGEKWNRVSQRWREGASGECRRRQSKYLVDPGILNKGQRLRSSVRSFVRPFGVNVSGSGTQVSQVSHSQ